MLGIGTFKIDFLHIFWRYRLWPQFSTSRPCTGFSTPPSD